jgi:hypothetical protein
MAGNLFIILIPLSAMMQWTGTSDLRYMHDGLHHAKQSPALGPIGSRSLERLMQKDFASVRSDLDIGLQSNHFTLSLSSFFIAQ